MIKENNNTEPEQKIDKLFSSTFPYIKILVLSFMLPMWIAVVVNGIVTLGKMLSWVSSDIAFWSNKTYLITTILLIIVFPIAYLLWFYYLTIKKTLSKLHIDLLADWNIEIGNVAANYLLETVGEKKSQMSIESILIYINEKLSRLPKLIAWIARKLIDQIPLVEFVNAFDYNDLKPENKTKIANSITSKINDFELDFIDNIVPGWCIFLIPLNILLIGFYLTL